MEPFLSQQPFWARAGWPLDTHTAEVRASRESNLRPQNIRPETPAFFFYRLSSLFLNSFSPNLHGLSVDLSTKVYAVFGNIMTKTNDTKLPPNVHRQVRHHSFRNRNSHVGKVLTRQSSTQQVKTKTVLSFFFIKKVNSVSSRQHTHTRVFFIICLFTRKNLFFI